MSLQVYLPTLGKPNKEANSIYLVGCVTARGTKGQDSPNDLECGDPDRWANPGQYKIARNLAEDIADCPESLHIIELVAIKTKVFFPGKT